MTVVNNLKSHNAITKISNLANDLCEYFETEDEIDGDDTFIEIDEHNEVVSIKIDREYIKIQSDESASLRDLIKLAENVSILPDGETVSVLISISV